MEAMDIPENATNMTVVEATDNIFLGTIYLGESVSVMITNGLIVFVIVKSEELHIATLWMIAVMGVTDFLMGFYYIIFVVPSAFLNRFVLSGRMVAVTRPLAYTRIVTTKRLAIGVAVSIVLNMCRLLVIILPDADYYYNANIALCVADFDTLPTVMAVIGFPLVTLTIIIVSSCRMYHLIKRDRNRVGPSDVMLLPQNKIRFPKWVFIAAGVFCLSYVNFLAAVIWNMVAKAENVPVVLVKLSAVAHLSNCLWNVFIYNSTYRPFREALAYLFCKSYYRKQKQDEIYSLHKTVNT